MAIVTLEKIKAHVIVDFGDDDDLLTLQINAAQRHMERVLGFKLDNTAGREGFGDGTPADLVLCACQIVAHWYNNREGVAEGAYAPLPFGAEAILNEYRDWTF